MVGIAFKKIQNLSGLEFDLKGIVSGHYELFVASASERWQRGSCNEVALPGTWPAGAGSEQCLHVASPRER